ncbi:MAG: CRISPR-associated protein Cas4 [Acidimicrobiales bacterium]
MVTERWPIRISALEHHQYCPRQCVLIHNDGVWFDNVHTVRGELGHRRADGGGYRTERGRTVVRAVPLWSEEHGLTGRADTVELTTSGGIVPVEYKIGTPHGVAAHLQLCAQALCLEEMTHETITEGAIWFSGPRRRFRVCLDSALRSQTIEAIDQIRRNFSEEALPSAPNDSRCGECQLIGHCLPGLVAQPNRVDNYVKALLRCD